LFKTKKPGKSGALMAARKKVRIDFCDFSDNFSKTNCYLYKLLMERFDVELCDQPDFLIYNCYGHEHRLHSGIRIFFCGESDTPDFRECDYSLAAVKLDDPRHLHVPHYVPWFSPAEIVKRDEDPEKILAAKTKFCAFVVGNYNPRKNHNRVAFFEKLSKYKRVDSGGKLFNNIGGPVSGGTRGKIKFLRDYKFNIAFENRSLAGYTTEKIVEPMAARCIPIYWGNPLIQEEFNTRSFLNYFDFPNEDALIEKIIEMDKDDAKYLEYARQPYFYNDTPNVQFSRDRILDFFEKIFTTKITPVVQAGRKTFSFGRLFGRWKLAKRHHWHPMRPPTWE
jgi:alpha(1,3/1,4) fucosyltransferase